MGYDITRQSLGWTLFFFAALALLFWACSALSPAPAGVPEGTAMPLGRLLARLSGSRPLLAEALAVLLALWNGLMIVRIISRNMILLERTYMPVVVYLVVACGSGFGAAMLAPLAASALMIGSFDRMMVSFRRVVTYSSLFNSSIQAGLALLVEPHTLVYALSLPVALVVFKKGWRDWIVCWTGWLLPMAIASYVYWGMGYRFDRLARLFAESVAGGFSGGGFPAGWSDPALLAFWGICVVVTGFSLVAFFRRAATMRTRAYRSFVYFLWILFFSALLFVYPGRSAADFPLIAAPLAVIIPTYFNRRGGWLPDVIYLLLLGSAVAYNLLALAGVR